MTTYTTTPTSTLREDDMVIFDVRGTRYKGHVHGSGFIINLDDCSNSAPLRAILGDNYKRKVREIYGYDSDGEWPTARNPEDLTRLVAHLYAVLGQGGNLVLGAKHRTRDGREVVLRAILRKTEGDSLFWHDEVGDTVFGSRRSGWYCIPDGQHSCDIVTLIEQQKPKAARVEIKPGMLIRNLRSTPIVGTVLDAEDLTVAYEDDPAGRSQMLIDDAEVRWPWEPESAWRRVKPAEASASTGPVALDGAKVGDVWRTRGGKEVTLGRIANLALSYPFGWSHGTTMVSGHYFGSSKPDENDIVAFVRRP